MISLHKMFNTIKIFFIDGKKGQRFGASKSFHSFIKSKKDKRKVLFAESSLHFPMFT